MNSQAWARGAPCVDPAVAAAAGHTDKSLTECVNLLVAQPTTPSNYYHLLRRQLVRPFRKPLVVIAPKTLLRLPEAASSWAQFAPGTRFQPLLGDASVPAAGVKRVLLVSGKPFYDLKARRDAAKDSATAILRVEELAPFPTAAIVDTLRGYGGVREVVWVQEEPSNAGAWTWAEAHLTPAMAKAGGALASLPLKYVGRPALSAPAVGLSKANKAQEEWLWKQLW